MISSNSFLIVSAALFCIGLYSVITRKNAVLIILGIELMINAALINFIIFSRTDVTKQEGKMFALFAIILAAAGVAVALAIILRVYEHYKNIDPHKVDTMKE